MGTILCLGLPIACGDDDDGGPMQPVGGSDAGGAPDAGAGGGGPTAQLPPGVGTMPKTEMCGADSCTSARVGPYYVDPCCDATDTCGLNTGFLTLVGAQFKDLCQAHDQAGDPSEACPDASGLVIPYPMGDTTLMVPLDPFVGCCRPNGSCGVVVDKISSGGGNLKLADFNLGCVDAAPFFPGKAAVSCGGDMPGGGGAGGGGAGGVPGGAGAGGGSGPDGGVGGVPSTMGGAGNGGAQ